MSEMVSSMSSRKAHPCDQCSKSFSSSHQLNQHLRIHTGDRPYTCCYCDRGFKQLSHLNQHTRLHTGERPYKCSVCSRAFIQLSNLQQHQKTHSSIDKIVKDSEKRFFCNHCGKGFKGQSSLITHENKKHSDAMSPIELFLSKDSRKLVKFNCQACGKAYSNEGSYRKHVESQHIGNEATSSTAAPAAAPSPLQLWSCNVCTSVFASEFSLLAHMDQMRSDPKHQFGTQIKFLNCVAGEKNTKPEPPASLNMLSSNLNALVAGGNAANNAEHDPVNISANMLAQNFIQLNQNRQLDDSPPLDPPSNKRTNGNETNDVSDFSSSHSAEANYN